MFILDICELQRLLPLNAQNVASAPRGGGNFQKRTFPNRRLRIHQTRIKLAQHIALKRLTQICRLGVPMSKRPRSYLAQQRMLSEDPVVPGQSRYERGDASAN